MTSPIGNRPVTCRDADDASIGNRPVTYQTSIGNQVFYEPEQDQGLPEHNRLREAGNRNSAEAEEDAGEKRKEESKEDAADEFEERAAILEYDAGFTRPEAERRAIDLDGLIEEGAPF